ncbi:OmpA family protein [Roseateles amylovorans]|uniref:OmpA family protein n=2 Tax=Roseateles amylovorans TaxID=2978473 RepID=A0ABY6B7S2_9BURK|nr:OmpA family protein [Roseateles amylovorans]
MLTACGALPERNTALERAHARFGAARDNPQVTALARTELAAAESSLGKADQAARDGLSLAEIDHLAYLAQQRTVIAQDVASGRAADAQTAGAAAERDRMRLSMRTQEADKAKADLSRARQDQAMQGNALAAADAQSARQAEALRQRNDRVRELEAERVALGATQTERGMMLSLSDTLFASGHSELTPGGVPHMDKVARFLLHNPARRATVEGYTDNVGGQAANQTLSEARANSVVAALVAQGVARDRLDARGYGSARPVATNATAAGRQMNRRVEVVFDSPMQGQPVGSSR